MWWSFLDREHSIADARYSPLARPARGAAIHLSIGQAYAFSVFNLPLTSDRASPSPAAGDWKQTELGWIFSIAIFFLGLSAAVFGRGWSRRPAAAMFVAAFAGLAASSSPRFGVAPTTSGCSTWATACWAAADWASATSRRSRP